MRALPEEAEVDSEAWAGCMRRQDLAGAWAISDRILARRDRATRDDASQPYHLRWVWDGTPPDGRQVLVRCYHGLGDTLQFARFLPALGVRAAHVTLEAPQELCALLAGLPCVDRLVPFDAAAPLPASECDIEIMELAHVLRADAAGLGCHVPYLRAPAGAANIPSGVDGCIGLCWQAGSWDPSRSLPLSRLLPACAASGRRFVSLQRGPASAEARGTDFVNPSDNDMDVLRTAALIAGLRAVVTVDSMVAHLAGALGRPVLLLVKQDADWRWPLPDGGCAWYPTMTVLHQRAPGEWDGALASLAAILADVIVG